MISRIATCSFGVIAMFGSSSHRHRPPCSSPALLRTLTSCTIPSWHASRHRRRHHSLRRIMMDLSLPGRDKSSAISDKCSVRRNQIMLFTYVLSFYEYTMNIALQVHCWVRTTSHSIRIHVCVTAMALSSCRPWMFRPSSRKWKTSNPSSKTCNRVRTQTRYFAKCLY